MYDAELRRAGIGEALRRNNLAVVVVRGLLAECAPHALELAAVRIEDRDAVIAVTIGHEQFVSWRIKPFIRRPVQIRRVGVALALIAVANLHDELAVLRELQELVVGHRLEPSQAVGGAIISTDPYEPLGVDMDAVLALRPFIALAIPAPGLDVIAGAIEHDDRRRSQIG